MTTATTAGGMPMTRGTLRFGGVLSIVLGLLAIIWPSITIGAIVILLGVQLMVGGVGTLVVAFEDEMSGIDKVLASFVGILGLIAGALVFARPLRSAGILIVVVGVFWLVGGLVDLIASIFGGSVQRRGIRVIGALATVAAGLVALAWPQVTALAFAWIIGFWMIAFGTVRLILSFDAAD